MRKIFLYNLIQSILVFVSPELRAQSWPKVQSVDLSDYKPSDFADDELDIPYYLKHFHTVANSVVETGPDKGFINIHVWRNSEGQKTYNARIMESILSLTYFYCNNRPWNVYRGDTALRLRLEAALDFWSRIQNKDGRFSEYGPQQWNLPATAFATKFMGEALILLKTGPPVNKDLLNRVIEADRKAIMIVLTDSALYAHGKDYSNQFTNVWAGALAYMSLYADPAMMKQLENRIKQSAKDFQSPAGFFYEAGGTDFGYNFNTHHSNLWMAYHFSRGTALANNFIEEEKRYYEWIAYNAVPEPGGYFTTNCAIEMRQKAPVVTSYFTLSPLGEAVTGVRAFNISREQKKLNTEAARKALERNWPNTTALAVGEFSGFSPYAFLHRRHYTWNPTEPQKKAAFQNLPYIKRNDFIHQKGDDRNPTVFSFVRKPSYYVTFNSGPRLKSQQRYGIGLLWHPVAGSFLQSQTGSDTAAWGTKSNGRLYEADTLDASFLLNGRQFIPRPGSRDLGKGFLTASYALGNSGKKSIMFREGSIDIYIDHPGNFTEHLPLLLNDGDSISISAAGEAQLKKPGATLYILFDPSAKPEIKETVLRSGSRRIVVLEIEAIDKLKYSFVLKNPVPGTKPK